LFVGPFFALLLIFGMFPLLFSLYIAFCDWNPASGLAYIRWDGLWGFHNVLTDPFYWPALWRSLGTSLAAVIPQHLLALPLAFGISLAFKRAQGWIGTVLFLPYMTSPLAAGGALGLAFLVVWGPLDAFLGMLAHVPFLEALRPPQDTTVPFEAFSLLWSTLGWNVLLYLMALGTIPRSLYEAAQVDGASLWMQFRQIALPLVRPMIFVAFTMSFLAGVQSNTLPPGFSSLHSTNVPAYAFQTAFFDMDFGLAAAQTWVLFAAMLLVVGLVYFWIGRNFTSLDVSAQGERDDGPLHLHTAALIVLKVVLVLALALAVLPILAVLLNATRTSGAAPLAVGQELGANYHDLLEAVPDFWRNVWNSTYVSVLAGLGAMVTSGLAGYAFALLKFRYRRTLYLSVLGLMLFPSLLNLIPTAMMAAVFGWSDQARAIWIPAAANAFGVFLVTQFMTSAVPQSVVEAARIDGAGNALVFRRIALPLALPVLITVGLITFIGTWNNTMSALAILHTPETQSVLQALSTVTRMDGSGRNAFLFGVAAATLPTLLLYLLTARHLTKAMNLTSAAPEAAAANRAGMGRRRDQGREDRSLPSSGLLHGADGIRALACLMVIMHHLWQRLDGQAQAPFIRELRTLMLTGQVGVSAFFVLSGMLLSLPFWHRYLAGQPPPALREYLRRRALRILPGFYTALAVSFLFSLALVPGTFMPWLRLVSAATFTSAFHPYTFFPTDLNGPLWSIGFEVVCYLLMPLWMLGLFAFFPQRRWSTGLLYWLGVFVVTLIAHQWLLTHPPLGNVGRGWEYGIIGGAKFWMPHYNPVGMYGHYILGILAAGVIAGGQRHRWGRHWRFDLIAISTLAGVLVWLWTYRSAPEFSHSIGSQPYFFPWFPLMIAVTLAALPFSRGVARLLDNRFFRYTARLSFGLYIWHYLLMELIRLLHNSSFVYAGVSSLAQWSLTSGVVLLLAYGAAALSYRHIEEPFLRGRFSKSVQPDQVSIHAGVPALVRAEADLQAGEVRTMLPSFTPPSTFGHRWQALRQKLDPANDESPPALGLQAMRWSRRWLPWLVGGVATWALLVPEQVDTARLYTWIAAATRNPQAFPVTSFDDADLYSYQYTVLGTTTLRWQSQQDWWLRIESPRFSLDDLAPQRERISSSSGPELYRITQGELQGNYLGRTDLEINVYSPAYYWQHQVKRSR